MEYFKEAVQAYSEFTVPQDIPIKGVKDINKQFIIPTSRWNLVGDSLVKTYLFSDVVKRRRFVSNLLAYEERIGKYAMLSINGHEITITVQTELNQRMSKLDKTYARYVDALFKDVVYSA